MEPSTPLVPHERTPSRAPKRRGRIIAIVILALVLGVLLATLLALLPGYRMMRMPTFGIPSEFTRLRTQADRFWLLHHMPAELVHATFVSEGKYGPQKYYRAGATDFVPVDETRPAPVAKLLADPISKGLIIRPTGLSRSGTVAYSVLFDGSKPANPDAWQVEIYSANGSNQAIGSGLSPFFMDESHVGRFSASGIVVANLYAIGSTTVATTTGTLAVPVTLPAVHTTPRVSPDNRFVAFYDEAQHRITVLNTHLNFAVAAVYPDAFSSFALSNDHLYVLRNTDAGTTVLSIPLTGGAGVPKPIYTLPASLDITDIRFPS